MKKTCDSYHSFRSGTKGSAFVCALATIVLSGCASTQQSIDAAAGKFRPQELEARQAMLAGRHALAHIRYAEASEQIDSTDDTYVDGLFYLDHARMEGNRAFMALLDADVAKSRDHFSSSESYLNSGVRAHKAVFADREDSQQGVASLLEIGAMVGVAAVGIDASSDASYEQSEAIWDATGRLMELTVDTFVLISSTIAEIHEIDVHDDAQHVDPDAWRAAAISDHPIPRSVVRVFSGPMEGPSSCTGFFIQPRLVATSAHCLDESDPDDVRVEVHDPRHKEHFLRGRPVSRLTTERVYWPRTYDWDRVCHPDDVALIVVGEDNPSEYWLPINTKPIEGQPKALVIGYSGDLDRGFFQRIDYGCKIEESSRTGQIHDNCATYGGNSGGPILLADYNQATDPFRVAGIVSCGPREYAGQRPPGRVNTAAGMPPLERLYRGVIAQNPGLGNPQLFE